MSVMKAQRMAAACHEALTPGRHDAWSMAGGQ
jgi:hypothetical protein